MGNVQAANGKLLEAAKEGRLEDVQRALKAGAEINTACKVSDSLSESFYLHISMMDIRR